MTGIEPTITITSLSKRYSQNSPLALDNLSLKIYPGEVYGFLGPNGAGKSTTIRMLMNFLKPTSGSITIGGLDSVTDSVAIRQSVGFLAGDFAMYPKMSGKQFLDYMCDLQNGSGKKNMPELARRLEVDLDKKLGELSRGNRQKIGIIQAFMHEPQVLILDEPTSGLDPLVQETFFELIEEAKSRHATIFMSSHVLSEVQKMCDRVGIIRQGKLVSESDIKELKIESAQTFDIVFEKAAPINKLKKISGAQIISHKHNRVSLHMHGKLSELFAVLAHENVSQIDAHNLDLEEIFMQYYKEQS